MKEHKMKTFGELWYELDRPLVKVTFNNLPLSQTFAEEIFWIDVHNISCWGGRLEYLHNLLGLDHPDDEDESDVELTYLSSRRAGCLELGTWTDVAEKRFLKKPKNSKNKKVSRVKLPHKTW